MSKILSQNVCYVAYPRSAQAYGDAMDSNLGEPGKDINICLKLSQNVCYVAYPRSAQAYVDAMDFNLGEPGKDINICLKFCLKMFVMLHIPEALRHMVMPWTPNWVNEKGYSNARVNSIMLFLLKSV